ncbi:MAG: LysR family transcriptional regulator [Actinomycetota bacterium]|nr:LysR family transcriptional regulator [Actinomycetota bacterium]
MNLDRLRCLRALAIHGSVTSAAAVLHMTPSGVSQQLNKLEREVGHELIERRGRGVELTDAGQRLAKHAESVLSLVEEVSSDMEQFGASVAGTVRLASFATAARGLVPGALAALRGEHPDLRVELAEVEPPDALRMLGAGELDVAVVQDWVGAPLVIPATLGRIHLVDDVVDLAVSVDHPLASATIVDLDEVLNEPWIAWQHGSMCTDWLIGALRAQGSDPDVVHAVGEHPTQLALIAAGLGVGVIPRLGRGPTPEGVRFVPTRPALTREIYGVWRRSAEGRPSTAAVVDALRGAAGRVCAGNGRVTAS